MIGAQHIGALRHEVHAAEDDELGLGVLAYVASELEGVAGIVGEFDHFVALIVMAENNHSATELRLGRGDAALHLLVREAEVLVGQRLAFRDVVVLVRREDWKKHMFTVRLKPDTTLLRSRSAQVGPHAGGPSGCRLSSL